MSEDLNSFIEGLVSNVNSEQLNCDAGCSEANIDTMWDKCRELMPNKVIRTVKNWQWWDLEIPNGIQLPNGIEPSIIYSNYVIKDSSGTFDEGNWVRSTPLTGFHHNCIFETKNTFYILVGNGIRKSVDPNHAFSLIG